MDPTSVVTAWTAAWNAQDVDALVELAHEDVLLEVPRGPARGHAGIRELIGRQSHGVRLHVLDQRYAARGGTVVSFGPIEFRQIEDGDRVVHRDTDAAAVFEIRDGRVMRFAPYAERAAAFRDTGLDPVRDGVPSA